MHTRTARAALGAVAVLAIGACAPMQVRTDYDPQMSFSQYRTYSWIAQDQAVEGDPAVNSPLVARRIRHAVDSALASMGYQQVTSGTPDFRVAYLVASGEKVQDGIYYGHGGYRGGHGRHGGGYPGYSYEYLEGTLVLDIVDARTNDLVWRGWAKDALHDNPKPENVQKYVNEAVANILKSFPPGPPRPLEAERPVAAQGS